MRMCEEATYEQQRIAAQVHAIRTGASLDSLPPRAVMAPTAASSSTASATTSVADSSADIFKGKCDGLFRFVKKNLEWLSIVVIAVYAALADEVPALQFVCFIRIQVLGLLVASSKLWVAAWCIHARNLACMHHMNHAASQKRMVSLVAVTLRSRCLSCQVPRHQNRHGHPQEKQTVDIL